MTQDPPATLDEPDTDCEVIAKLRAENERLRVTLQEVVDDLASEVEARYRDVKDHPAMARKYERDMDSVQRARLYLESRHLEQEVNGGKNG